MSDLAPVKSNAKTLLRVDQVSRAFDDGAVKALDEISFVVDSGEYVAIMGPSGSGKSTLLNLLGALDRPSSGEIYFCEKPMSECRDLDRFRSQSIGFVFQSFHLLPTLTAIENVQIPMFEGPLSEKARIERAAILLERVGMSHRAGTLPMKLSVGERQRVAIARALANHPKLLLADEPTGNLDSKSGQVVLDLFDRLRQDDGVTIVMITHGPEVAARAERIVWIRDGKLFHSPPAVESP